MNRDNNAVPSFSPAQSEDDGVRLALFKDGISLAVVDFTPAEFADIQAKATAAGISFGDLLERAANVMAAEYSAPKIPKGYVMVNLTAWQQKEIQAMAREMRLELRGVLRGALVDMHSRLKEFVRIKRMTGLGIADQNQLFGWRSETN